MSNPLLKTFQKVKRSLIKEYRSYEKELVSIRKQHEGKLEERRKELEKHGIIIVGGRAIKPKFNSVKIKKRKMSKAGRAAIVKAQKARWAKLKSAGK